jgi:hypothetical protein
MVPADRDPRLRGEDRAAAGLPTPHLAWSAFATAVNRQVSVPGSV